MDQYSFHPRPVFPPLFPQNVFPQHYGLRFDTTLQILVWEFLSRLEELLPVSSFVEAGVRPTPRWCLNTIKPPPTPPPPRLIWKRLHLLVFQVASNSDLDSLDTKLEDFGSDAEDLRTLLQHSPKGFPKSERCTLLFLVV